MQTLPNLSAGWVSIELGTRGPLLSESSACAASSMAIGDGLDAIRLGRADVMFCGGTEAPVTPVGIAGFGAMRALCHAETTILRPPRARSTADRDGFVMAEGAAVVVLEELEHALARGAHIYAELAGYGTSSDAYHVSDTDPTGENPARALQMAFADAGIDRTEVGYVNAHGTSTPIGDAGETRVLKLALGEDKAYRTPVSSTKGATGHTLGAAGAIEAAFTILALERGVLPPTINQHTAGSGVRPRLHPERRAERAGRDRHLELVRVRRPQHRSRVPALALRPGVAAGLKRFGLPYLQTSVRPIGRTRGGWQPQGNESKPWGGSMSTVIDTLFAPWQKARERQLADAWLRSSNGTFIPEKYGSRAEELCSPKHRRMLAETLRKIERSANDRTLGRSTIVDLAAVRAHRHELRALVRLLETQEAPVTPAGMLRVVDLITEAGSPLYAVRGERLGEEIAVTIELLRARGAERAAA